MLKAIWRDPVVSGLIVAGVGTTAVAYFTRFFGWVWEFLLSAYNWMGEPSQIPNWAVVLNFVVLAPTLLIVLLIYLEGRRSDSDPTVWDYREDMFFNLKWRWNYSGNKMVRMSCYCPYCDYQIVPVESEDFMNGGFFRRCKFFCESCNSSLHSADGFAAEVKDKAELHVQRKIRTGEWKNSLLQPSKGS